MDFVRLITPADDEFVRRGLRIYRDRPDLQQVFPDPTGTGFAKWLATNGVLEYPDRLAGYYPPLPPVELRRGSFGTTDLSHLSQAVEDLHVITDLLRTFRPRPIDTVESILDFGCGSGRMVRWLPRAFPNATIYGSDVRAASIDWCRQHLSADGRARFLVNDFAPPLALPDDSVELIYAISVFTHLDRDANRAWLAELARVCRPDGLLLLTTIGAFGLLALTRDRALQELLDIDEELARDYLRRLEQQNFIHHGLSPAAVAQLGVGPTYGHVICDRSFVAAVWEPHVRVLGHVPVSLGHFQDFYVLQPR